jgi:hypothetical protein
MPVRVPLSSVVLPPQLLSATSEGGSNYTVTVKNPANSANATIWNASSGTGTITQPVAMIPGTFTLRGYVDEGIYTFNVQGYSAQLYVGGGASTAFTPSSDPFHDPATTVQNYSWALINSLAATTTSQTIKFVHIVPRFAKTAAKIVSMSGSTAAATITKTIVGLYSSDGTTLTKLDESTGNLTSGLWDSTNTIYRQALGTGTSVLVPGQDYYAALLVNATTAGNHQGFVKVANVVSLAATELAIPPMYTLASQTSLPSTQLISGLTAAFDLVPWVGIQ